MLNLALSGGFNKRTPLIIKRSFIQPHASSFSLSERRSENSKELFQGSTYRVQRNCFKDQHRVQTLWNQTQGLLLYQPVLGRALDMLFAGVFGEARVLNYLGRDDITQFLSMQEISAICVSLLMSHLWQILKRRNMARLFVFVDPRCLLDPSEDRRKLLAHKFEIACERLVTVPFKKGRKHWVLLVVQPRKREVYCLDSHKEGTLNSGLRFLVNLALYDALKKKGCSLSLDALFADYMEALQSHTIGVERKKLLVISISHYIPYVNWVAEL